MLTLVRQVGRHKFYQITVAEDEQTALAVLQLIGNYGATVFVRQDTGVGTTDLAAVEATLFPHGR
jgi:hypothetical protein